MDLKFGYWNDVVVAPRTMENDSFKFDRLQLFEQQCTILAENLQTICT